MAVKILEIKKESCPATRFIGKKYDGFANWGEWWEMQRSFEHQTPRGRNN